MPVILSLIDTKSRSIMSPKLSTQLYLHGCGLNGGLIVCNFQTVFLSQRFSSWRSSFDLHFRFGIPFSCVQNNKKYCCNKVYLNYWRVDLSGFDAFTGFLDLMTALTWICFFSLPLKSTRHLHQEIGVLTWSSVEIHICFKRRPGWSSGQSGRTDEHMWIKPSSFWALSFG